VAFVACGLAVLVIVAGVIVNARLGGGETRDELTKATAARTACSVRESTAGYPDSYLTRRLPFKVHPPLPVGGWQPRGLAFDVLFHSLFHGYLVVAYRSDLPEHGRVVLRAWVRAHQRERVVAVRTSERGAPLVGLAEWGWEARCDREPSVADLMRFAARRA
jgi:hypothetical protein